MNNLELIAVGLLSLCAAILLWQFSLMNIWAQRSSVVPSRVVFLFKRGFLVDASPEALQLLEGKTGTDLTWKVVRATIQDSFPSLPEQLETKPRTTTRHKSIGRNDQAHASLLQDPKFTRLELISWSPSTGRANTNVIPKAGWVSFMHAAEKSPVPIWQVGPNGQISWKNEAFEQLIHSLPPAQRLRLEKLKINTRNGAETPRRLGVQDIYKRVRQFDVSAIKISNTVTNFAVDVTAIFEAEQAKQDFIQALGQTFAHIPIGLAIFDRNRQLVLFNPALLDLLDFSAEFLVSRPTLQEFYYDLIDRKIVPETEELVCWKEQLTKLILKASGGSFSETWVLPNCRTCKISGRPHPDGALAFLIEDVTDENMLYDASEVGQNRQMAMFDTLEDGVALIDDKGHVQYTNKIFRHFIGIDPESSFAAFTATDLDKVLAQYSNGKPSLLDVPPTTNTTDGITLNLPDQGFFELHVKQLSDQSRLVQIKRRNSHLPALEAKNAVA